MTAAHFEAKKHAFRQTQDGVVISFVVHPSDVNAMLAMAPLGTRFMVAFAEIGEDEQAVVQSEPSTPITIGPRKEHEAFAEMKAPKQAGILCTDARFRAWLAANYRREYDAAEAELATHAGVAFLSEDIAAQCVRKICGVHSRGELTKANPHALREWEKLLAKYDQHKLDTAYGENGR